MYINRHIAESVFKFENSNKYFIKYFAVNLVAELNYSNRNRCLTVPYI